MQNPVQGNTLLLIKFDSELRYFLGLVRSLIIEKVLLKLYLRKLRYINVLGVPYTLSTPTYMGPHISTEYIKKNQKKNTDIWTDKDPMLSVPNSNFLSKWE